MNFQQPRRVPTVVPPSSSCLGHRCLRVSILSLFSPSGAVAAPPEPEANLLLRDPRRLDCANGEPLSPPWRRIGLSLLFLLLRVFTGPILRSRTLGRPRVLRVKVDNGKASRRRRKFEPSCTRARCESELEIVSWTFDAPPPLIPLAEGIRLILGSSSTWSSRSFSWSCNNSLLAMGFTAAATTTTKCSFKRLVFPVGTRQPQQRHEKRLINKLIRFLLTPVLAHNPRASISLSLFLFFFFLANTSVPLLPVADGTHGTVELSLFLSLFLGFRKHDTTDSTNPTHVSLAR